jgi:hypothetical protein
MTDPLVSPIGPEDSVYPDIATSPAKREAVKEAYISALERRRQREHNELVAVLNTEAGQAVIMRILAHCRPYHSTWSMDQSVMVLAEGKRAVGLWLIQEIQHVDPEMYAKLLLHRVKQSRDEIATEEAHARAK